MMLRAAVYAFSCLIACASVAQAQSAAPAAPASSAQATPYQDQLIDDGRLPQEDAYAIDEAAYNTKGLPRSLKLETQLGSTRFNESSSDVRGLLLRGQIDTPQYGAFSLDFNYRNAPAASIVTLRQNGMPFDGGWQANNVLGIFNTPATDLVRYQPRFALPSTLLQGAGTQWVNDSKAFTASANIGKPVAFEGAILPRLKALGGNIVELNAQGESGGGLTAAAALVAARDVTDTLDPSNPVRYTRNGGYVGLKQTLARTSFQLNAVASSQAGAGSHAALWLDAQRQDGPVGQTAGLFKFDKDMFWGSNAMVSDISGAYYRYAFRNRRWALDAGVEWLHSPSGSQSDGMYVNGAARYQYSRDISTGGGAALRKFGGTATSMFAFADWNNPLGNTRVQTDASVASARDRSFSVTADHSWNLDAGRRLATSVAFDKSTAAGLASTGVSTSLLAGASLQHNLSVDAQLRYRRSSDASNATNLNLGLNWQLNSHWLLNATLYENRGTFRSVTQIDPLTPPIVNTNNAAERSIVLVLRYEDHAGSSSVPLGGKPGDASGRIAGVVYFDENDNARRDAAEKGAANVSVLLDGRFTVSTGADGQFEFPLVAAGRHTISVITDNLPLPWGIPATASKLEVFVSARGTSAVELGATRIK